jgi:hypothetical protein
VATLKSRRRAKRSCRLATKLWCGQSVKETDYAETALRNYSGPRPSPEARGWENRMRRMTQQQIEEWNEIFPVGSPCWVTLDDGSELALHTRSKAYECLCVDKGHVVIKVEGLSRSLDLDRVRMAETHSPNVPALAQSGGEKPTTKESNS